ncbi:MAG: hypothetical protein ACR2NM_05410, partial [Bythopirellula sp.]
LNQQFPRKKPELEERLYEILVGGDETLLFETIVTLCRLNGETVQLVIERVEDRVSQERREALTAAAQAVENTPGGSGHSGGGGFF